MIRIGNQVQVGVYAFSIIYLVINILGSGKNEYEPMISSIPSVVETDVLIIGAGIAGFTAADTPREQGVKFKILEASGQIGGRLQKTNQFGVGFDLGTTLVYEPAWIQLHGRM